MSTPTDAPAWLRDVLADLARAQGQTAARVTWHDDRFDHLETRLDLLTTVQEQVAALLQRHDARFDRIETRLDGIDTRLDRLTTVQEQMAVVLTQQAERLDQQTERLDRQGESLARLTTVQEQMVVVLTQQVKRLDQQTERLDQQTERLDRHTDQLGELIGHRWESRVREHPGNFLRSIAERVRVLPQVELDHMLREAEEGGTLSRDQTEEIRRTDLVCSGVAPGTTRPVYIVVEVSARVAVRDVERAARRAGLLAAAGKPALPVVVGERISRDAEHQANVAEVRTLINQDE